MALYTIGDLHLSLGKDKPMDIFGSVWEGHPHRLEAIWREMITPEDTVVLLGDLSWGMSLEECIPDFAFVHSLPGKKLLIKGNHDYYWTTRKKMETFLAEKGFTDISFLHNSSVLYTGSTGSVALCGTRGWCYEEEGNDKIYQRELGRLETSLKTAPVAEKKVAFLHYPPFGPDGYDSAVTALLQQYGVSACYYGHLHGPSLRGVIGQRRLGGIDYYLSSADYLNFTPRRITLFETE